MSSKSVIAVDSLSKSYQIYASPRDRLKQFLLPPARSLLGMAEKQYFRDFWALQDISFEVERGQSVGVLGRNGSGKSTLLQLISGTLASTQGQIRVDGKVTALLELGSGFNPEFSGEENVILSLMLQGWSRDQAAAKLEDIERFADIGEFINQPVKTYSSGMYARLAFSSAIHSEPEILIVDEILAVGDAPFQQKCFKHIYRMLDDGVTVLMVSHDAYQIRSICSQALLLEKGQQIKFGPADEVIDEYISRTASEITKESNLSDETKSESIADAGEDDKRFLVSIHNPRLIAENANNRIQSNDSISFEFSYKIHGSYSETLSFVINFYREDGVYVFGTTTGMQGIESFEPHECGRVRVDFPCFPLVSGKYSCRVAVNDGRGLNILAEAAPAFQFSVFDDFKAVGIVDIPHRWKHEVIDEDALVVPTNGQKPIK